MKGLVLSGGAGTRLRPITHTSAKQLVPVANKPVLFYGLEAFREAGIEEVGIVVGDTAPEIEAAVGDGSRFGLRVTYLPQEAPLGLAHAVLISEDYLADEPFVMYLGDNLLREGIALFVRRFAEASPDALILLQHVDDPQSYGIAELDGDAVVQLVEKPKEPKSDLALVGVYLFTPAVFESVKAIKPSWRNELEITDAIQHMIDRGLRVEPHTVTGWWKDTGKLEDILEANRLVLSTLHDGGGTPSAAQTSGEAATPRRQGAMCAQAEVAGELDETSSLEGPVSVGAGTRLANTRVRGPVVIGERCTIADAFIGPYTAIADDVEVRDAEIEHSIVLENSRICSLGARMTDSLVGRGVVIERSDGHPVAYRFMVGDSSRIGIL
jgi:glucose-1-phosphate thymidylyltransferase